MLAKSSDVAPMKCPAGQ